MTNELIFVFKIAEQAVQQQIAEMQATWQDPTAAWDTTDAWGDDAAQLNTSAANTTTTSVQIETASSVTDSVHASGDANVIKCIAFYPYTVCHLSFRSPFDLFNSFVW